MMETLIAILLGTIIGLIFRIIIIERDKRRFKDELKEEKKFRDSEKNQIVINDKLFNRLDYQQVSELRSTLIFLVNKGIMIVSCEDGRTEKFHV